MSIIISFWARIYQANPTVLNQHDFHSFSNVRINFLSESFYARITALWKRFPRKHQNLFTSVSSFINITHLIQHNQFSSNPLPWVSLAPCNWWTLEKKVAQNPPDLTAQISSFKSGARLMWSQGYQWWSLWARSFIFYWLKLKWMLRAVWTH